MQQTCAPFWKPKSTLPRICVLTRAASIGRLASASPVTAPSTTHKRNTFGETPRLIPQKAISRSLKRGIYGIYQHVSEEHLHRYLAEFDFRYSNRIALGVDDVERTERAIRGIIGKRLTYRTTHSQAAPNPETA